MVDTLVDSIKGDLGAHMDGSSAVGNSDLRKCTLNGCTYPKTSSDYVFMLGGIEVRVHMTLMLRELFRNPTLLTSPTRSEIFEKLCIIAVGESEHASSVWMVLMDAIRSNQLKGPTCILRGSLFSALFCATGFCLQKLKAQNKEQAALVLEYWEKVPPPPDVFPPTVGRIFKLASASVAAHRGDYRSDDLDMILHDCLVVSMTGQSREITSSISALVELIVDEGTRRVPDPVEYARNLVHILSLGGVSIKHTPTSIVTLAPLAFILIGATEVEKMCPVFDRAFHQSPSEYVEEVCRYLGKELTGVNRKRAEVLEFTRLFLTLAPLVLRDEHEDEHAAPEFARLREVITGIKAPRGLQRSLKVERWKTALVEFNSYLKMMGKLLKPGSAVRDPFD